MELNEKYLVYKTAFDLVYKNNYEIVYINGEKDEIWLEHKKSKRIVRLIRKGFDWQNHLRKDIAIVFQQLKSLKKVINTKTMKYIISMFQDIHQLMIGKY